MYVHVTPNTALRSSYLVELARATVALLYCSARALPTVCVCDVFQCSSYYREIVTTEKNLLGVCMLFVFLYDLVIIDESIRISKNDKFFILVKVAEYPIEVIIMC